MKFGQHLIDNKVPEWKDMYLDYDRLKKLIKAIEALQLPKTVSSEKGTSLSVPKSTSSTGTPADVDDANTQEQFFSVLEGEMKKIELFTKKMVYIMLCLYIICSADKFRYITPGGLSSRHSEER